MHSALEPFGVQAQRILALFSYFTWISVAVFVLVIGAFVLALSRKRTAPRNEELPVEPAKKRVVGAALALTVVTLLVMLVLSIRTSRALACLGDQEARDMTAYLYTLE